ncbi:MULTISPECIES: amidohydrolase family protein [unclassified Streptomyces]|uniref:amidohydrolase family protein n=1 Tax=unclassified Streptomyces TaxID=2593676 RepID=UPI000DD9A0A6|nr:MULTISPECIES: amidohydrolase family protein [unclassified Streptomyces]QZZ31021.1 amidohydrolase family protein [Streptomyces sp. ST1015]
MRLPRRNLLTAAAVATAAVSLSTSPASAGGPRTPPKGRILIRGGHVVDTEPRPTARPGTDILVEGGRIAAVGRGLRAAGATVVDATGHIVLPGFVDTHRHLWQTALRSASVDTGLDAYFGLLHQVGPRFRPQDVHIATLAGALECLDAGITTQLDFAHIAYTPDLADAAVDALETAGLRTVFGYGTPVDVTGGGQLADVRRVRERLADDTALVTMAYAPLGPLITPMETVTADWRIADELDLPLTVHLAAGPPNPHPVTALRDAGLLRRRTLYVHLNGVGDDELKLIADSGAAASATPGDDAARLKRAGITTGTGVDTVAFGPGDMFSTMRAVHLAGQGQPGTTAADVLRMATLDGAAALGLADRIGSLRPGKQADIVMIRLDDLNMLTAERDPVDAVVTAAQLHNVDTVLVAGKVVKSGGRLVHADVRRTARALRETAAVVTGRG